MKNPFSRFIENSANAAIIVIAVVLTINLVPKLLPKNPMREVDVGSRMSLPLDWGASAKNIVLVLSKGCKYCSASADFYKRLAAKARQSEEIRLIGVFPQNADEAKSYLKEMDIPIGTIMQAPPSSIGVRVTPTLILADKNGIVIKSWIGKLSAALENEVLSEIQKLGSSAESVGEKTR